MTCSISYKKFVSILTLIVGLFYLCSIVPSFAQITQKPSFDKAEKRFRSQLPAGTIVSVSFYDLDKNKIVYRHNAHQMMTSASLSKIPTALSSHSILGKNFQFVTKLQTTSRHIKKNVMHSDLWVTFGADPTLTDAELRQLFHQLKRRGIQRIKGNIYIDMSLFSGYPYGTGWAWDDLSIRYAAPITAGILNRNAFRVSLSPAKRIGQPAVLKFQKPAPPIKLNNDIITEYPTPPQVSGKCELDLVMEPNNYYQLTGCIEPKRSTQQLFFAINDPGEFISYHIKRALQHNNIQFTGNIVNNAIKPTKKLETLAEHRSKPLNEILAQMLKSSNNLMADTLFKFIGHRYYKTAGTFDNGSRAMRNILKDNLNIDLKNAVLVDGSGLSSYNLISADTIMQLLIIGWKIPKSRLDFPQSLSIAGRDGTLEHRAALKREKLSGRVSAKTGTLSGVSNLAGYLITKNNRHIAFVIMLNHYSPDAHGRRGRKDGSDNLYQADWLSWVYRNT